MSAFTHSYNTGCSHPFSNAVIQHIFYIIQHTSQSYFAFPIKYLTLSHSKFSVNKAFSCFTKKKKAWKWIYIHTWIMERKNVHVKKMAILMYEKWHCNIHFNGPISALGFPGGSDGKEPTCNVGDLGSVPGLGRSPGGRNDNPLQYSCVENSHGQRSPVGYSPWGCRVIHNWATKYISALLATDELNHSARIICCLPPVNQDIFLIFKVLDYCFFCVI